MSKIKLEIKMGLIFLVTIILIFGGLIAMAFPIGPISMNVIVFTKLLGFVLFAAGVKVYNKNFEIK